MLKSKRRTEEPLEREVRRRRGGVRVRSADAGGERVQRREPRALETALLKLPTKYREVLVLKDAEDLSYEEIRGILQLPITTLKIRVVRARAMLREIIESQGLTASSMVLR